MRIFTSILISLILFSCDNDIKISETLSIQKWDNEGYSLNYNHEGSWLAVVLPAISKYDRQDKYLLLERKVINNELQYFIINIDSLNYPESLDNKHLTKDIFLHKIDSIGISYNFKSL